MDIASNMIIALSTIATAIIVTLSFSLLKAKAKSNKKKYFKIEYKQQLSLWWSLEVDNHRKSNKEKNANEIKSDKFTNSNKKREQFDGIIIILYFGGTNNNFGDCIFI